VSYAVSLTREALEDLQRLESFPIDTALEHGDMALPERALAAIRSEFRILERNPFTCRIAFDDRLERELVIPFGAAGYVALFFTSSVSGRSWLPRSAINEKTTITEEGAEQIRLCQAFRYSPASRPVGWCIAAAHRPPLRPMRPT
jgi:hypothetical protein